VVTDDGGTTSRSFRGPPGRLRLHLSKDRVFVLASTAAPDTAFYSSALHELDLNSGTFGRPAGDVDLGDAEAAWLDEDRIVSVSFLRSRAVRVATYRVRDNAVATFDVACTVEGCDQPGSPSFHSQDGVTFTAIATPTTAPSRECAVSVHIVRKTITSTCRKAPVAPADPRFVIGLGAARIVQPPTGPSTLYAPSGAQWFQVKLSESADDPLCLPIDNTGNLSGTCPRTVHYLKLASARTAIAITKERQYKDTTKQQWREVFRSKVVSAKLTPTRDPFPSR